MVYKIFKNTILKYGELDCISKTYHNLYYNNDINKVLKMFKEIFGIIPEKRKLIKINNDQKIELCKKYYQCYKCIPKRNDIIDEWKIGSFIKYMRKNKNKQHPLRPKLEEIFHCKFD